MRRVVATRWVANATHGGTVCAVPTGFGGMLEVWDTSAGAIDQVQSHVHAGDETNTVLRLGVVTGRTFNILRVVGVGQPWWKSHRPSRAAVGVGNFRVGM